MSNVFIRMIVLGGLCGSAIAAESVNAPQFLSRRELDSGEKQAPPERWSANENVRWKTDLPGLGWSSPIVWGRRIFVTTCVSSGQGLEPRKGLYIEDLDANKYPKPTDAHTWKVYCLDLDDGRVLWERTAHEGVPPKPHHLKNTLASESPATDGRRVFAYFGNIGLYCYDLDGNLLWSKPFEARETRYGWGTSISPVVHDDRVYIVNDNEEQSYLLALDAATGNEIWRVPRDEKTNYATPFVWQNDKRTEIVTSGIGWVRSYSLDGKLLWQLKGQSILAIPTPFARFDNLYVTSGHVAWGNNPMYAIRPGAEGDISPGEGQRSGPFLSWYLPQAGPYHPTPLIVGEQLYVLYDRGFLASYDAKTGEQIYSRQRIPNGRAFTSSPWSYREKLFCLNEDGVTFAIGTGPKFEVLYTNKLAEDDMCMATPVVLAEQLLIRSSARLYCIAEEKAEER